MSQLLSRVRSSRSLLRMAAPPLTVDDWPARPNLHSAPGPASTGGPQSRRTFLDLGADDEVNRATSAGVRTAAELDADLPAGHGRPHAGEFVVAGATATELSSAAGVGLGHGDPGSARVMLRHSEFTSSSSFRTRSPRGRAAFAARGSARPPVLDVGRHGPRRAVVLCTHKRQRAVSSPSPGRLSCTEVAQFEEFGAEQWFGVRHPGVRHATPADATRMAYVAEGAVGAPPTSSGWTAPGPARSTPTPAAAAAVTDAKEASVVDRDGEVVAFLLLGPGGQRPAAGRRRRAPLAPRARASGAHCSTLAEGRAPGLRAMARIRLFTHVTMVESAARLSEGLGFVETHRGGKGGHVRVFYAKGG